MTTAPWWKTDVIYQIYPRSFQDSDGDGIGDLRGVADRLEYVQALGVGAIWLSPIFPSPMADFGYDVSDYQNIDPSFGSLDDFDALIAAAHGRGLKVILDYVPNHSSDQHPWFLESRSSRTNPKRDWYIWRDGAADGGPPNNWISDFGGSSWTWDETTGQYYLHAFLKEQPDLNWRNPDVRATMMKVLSFWLDRGVDGFRIDVLWHIVKAEGLPNNPGNPDYHPSLGEMYKVLQLNSTDQPEVHEIAAEMRALADSYPGDRVLIGEIYLPVEKLVQYYGSPSEPGVHLPFNFMLIGVEWSSSVLKSLIAEYESALPDNGWPNWVLGNHDRPRIADRLGEPQARVAAVLLLTLRGTPTVYYGDELAIGHVRIPDHQIHDPRELREPGLGLGRDPVRTPMPWNKERNAGFTRGEPWLPLNEDWRDRNVATQRADPGSMWSLHHALLSLRAAHPALTLGKISLIDAPDGTLAYERWDETGRLLVVLNLQDNVKDITLPSWASDGRVLISTLARLSEIAGSRLKLAPNEAVVLAGAATS